MPATYVGIPPLAVIPLPPDKAAARLALGLVARRSFRDPPGSAARKSSTSPSLLCAALQIRRERPAVRFVTPRLPAQGVDRRRRPAAGLSTGLKSAGRPSHAVLAACDVTLIASGTATLDAALFKRPMVSRYDMTGSRRADAAQQLRGVWVAQHPVRRVRRA